MKYLFVFLLAFYAYSGAASPLPDFPFVTVEGNAVKEVRPDIAVVRFEITTFSNSSEAANKALYKVTEEVLKIANELQIPTEALTSYEIEKQIKRKTDEDYNALEILGYEFSRSVKIELDTLNTYSELIHKLTVIDNVHNVSTDFDTSQREKLEIELISKAAKNARHKATIMAKGLGVQIDSVFAFNEFGSFNSFFSTFQLSNNLSRISVTGSRMREQIFIPKYIEIEKSINVIYKLQ